MKYIFGLALCMSIVACTPKAIEGPIVPQNILPKELADCQFFSLYDSNGGMTRVVRCPIKGANIGNIAAHEGTNTASQQECINGELHKISLAPNNSLVATVYSKNGQPISCEK